MLQIIVKRNDDLYDESRNEFVSCPECKLYLEHSLVSISKWEAKWHKPFLNSKKTDHELLDYIKCMTTNTNKVDDLVYSCLTNRNIEDISKYIDDPMTATTFSKRDNNRPNSEIVTSELIYYWMIAYNIPFECQKWHINRLMTLIRVCSVKNSNPGKLTTNDLIKRNALNAQRRASMGTRG